MTTVCQMCGKTSSNDKVCSHCNAEIIPFNITQEFVYPPWGWATFDLSKLEGDTKSQVVDKLKDEWSELEKFTVLKLSHSQLDRFNGNPLLIKVLIREDFYLDLLNRIHKFQKIPMHFRTVGHFSYAAEINTLLDTEH